MARTPTTSRPTVATRAKPAAAVRETPAVPRISTTRASVPHPLPKMHFRAFIDAEEVDLVSISALNLPDGEHTDPEIRQTVTLRRGVGPSRLFYDWNQTRFSKKDDTRTVTIVLLDQAGGRPVNIWQLVNARPVRWSGPDLDAMGNGIAMEELEIGYDGINWRNKL